MSFSYATPTSGLSAGGIGWFNFNNITINPGNTLIGLTGTLSSGDTVTFDLSLSNTSGHPRSFSANEIPSDTDSFFGRIAYTNLAGKVSLCSDFKVPGPGVNTFTISNIKVVDKDKNPVSNFTVVLADAESTNIGEEWNFQTDGGAWELLTTLGEDQPTLAGLGTQTAEIVGTQAFPEVTQASYLLTTQAPSQIILTATENASGRQAIAIGVAVTRIKLQKYVAWRMDDSDEFVLELTGLAYGKVTTAGTANGLQPQTLQLYFYPGYTYNIDESMASGSISVLSEYTTAVSAINATPGGSFPPVGDLPISISPALGDDVTYTIYNQISYMYHLTVDKAYAEIGDILTYTVFIPNPNPYPITDVQFMDPTPPGTTYIGELWVDKAYTGTDPNSGILVTSVPPNGSVTMVWKVRINAEPIPSPLINVGYVEIPSGNDGVTSYATTAICVAHVTMKKAASKTFVHPGNWMSYTLTLYNAGNVTADEVIITDMLPIGVTLVPGSLTGATGTFPTLKLDAPLKSRETATVSYLVKVNDNIPTPDMLKNSATAVFHYTVDPAHPNSKTGTAASNTVIVSVFKSNFGQHMNDLAQSLISEKEEISALVNGECAKMQRLINMSGITPQELCCLKKCVANMKNSNAVRDISAMLEDFLNS